VTKVWCYVEECAVAGDAEVAAVGAGGQCCDGGDVRRCDEDPPDAGTNVLRDVEDAAAAATALVVDDAPRVSELRGCTDCICVSLRAACEGSDGVAAGGVDMVGACCEV
jgi:hypothetical protein